MPNYSEVKRILIHHQSHANAVLLRWLNPTNNWECWLFTGKKQSSVNIENSVTFLDQEARNNHVAFKQGNNSMTLRGFIPGPEQREGVKTLFTSPIVHAVIKGIEQPCSLVDKSQTLIDEMVKHGTLSLEINLERINSLTQ